MTGRVATGHLSCIVNTPHVTVIIRHNCRLYRNNSLLWVGRECLSVGTRLPCPSTPQLSSHRWSLLECHHVSVSVSSVCGPWAYPFYAASLFHNRNFFLRQVVEQVRGGKEVVHVQFMAKSFYLPCQISHCSTGRCQLLCRPLSLPR